MIRRTYAGDQWLEVTALALTDTVAEAGGADNTARAAAGDSTKSLPLLITRVIFAPAVPPPPHP